MGAISAWLRVLWVVGVLGPVLQAQRDPKQDLVYLLELPYLSLSVPRGGGKVVFSLPGENSVVVNTLADPAVPSNTRVVTIRNDTRVTAESLGAATSLSKGRPFSLYLTAHQRAARDLVAVLMSALDAEDLVQIAAAVRSMVNEELFVYCFCLAILQREDFGTMQLPLLVEIFPNQFVPHEQLTLAQNDLLLRTSDETTPMVVEHGLNFSGSDIKPEHRVSYWREDYGMNNHHWHWHLIYPVSIGIERDRKGELFYYMHQQMLARYDMERQGVGLDRVKPLGDFRGPIPDGYFSKLTVSNSGRNYGTRQDYTFLQDLGSGNGTVELQNLERWRNRLYDSIHSGYLVNPQGQHVPLSDNIYDGKRGIDLLGDAVEADRGLSVNSMFYGNLHNFGHVFIAAAHDPDGTHNEELGPMGFTGTSARDPVFYRWHKFIDDIFQRYKETQPPYTLEDLALPGIEVVRVGLESGGQGDHLITGWRTREFEATRGIDFASDAPVLLRLTHLDHQPFNYHIFVNNCGWYARQVTVRIFLAPKYNVDGREMSFGEQRLLWAEMDKFTAILNPGPTHLERPSLASSVTNTRDFTFRDLERNDTQDDGQFDFCGCGWPQHLLLPRGRPEGMTFQLFVLLTDYENDRVPQDTDTTRCANAVSYCGVLDAEYPDRRPMGFPFDRLPSSRLLGRPVTNAADYARLDNACIHDITITFTNEQLPELNHIKSQGSREN